MNDSLERLARYELFLSYCRADGRFANPLVDALCEQGVNLFVDACQWDQRKVHDEQKLAVRIEATISRAGAGMILWSKEAVDRKWVALEIDKLVARRAVDHLFPLFVVRLDGTNPPQELTLKASHEFSVNTLAELNNLALLVAADLQLPPDGPKGSAHVQCPHCNAEEAWNTIFCRVCKKHVFPQCPVCGAKAHCRHLDTSGGEIYFAEFQVECHNPRCGHRDSYKSCAGHAGEWWQPQECTYCEAHF